MAAPLPERIMAAIARADSRNPASADAVFAALRGVSRAAFDAAVIELEQQRRICICLITSFGITRLVLWPTGVSAPAAASWNNEHLFTPDTPRRFPVRPKPVKEKSMKNTRQPSQDKLTGIINAIAGRSQADAIKLVDIGESIGLDRASASATLKSALDHLVKAGDAATVMRPGETGRMSIHVYDPSAVATDSVAAPATSTDLPSLPSLDSWTERARAEGARTTPASQDQPEQARFGLWDDGSLTIVAGDDVIQLDMPQVKRLALLLGVSAPEARA